MGTTLAPYLNFPGNSREAMTFYHEVFGGDLTILSFGDFGMADAPADGVMHAALKGDGFSVFASDAMPGSEQQWGTTRIYCAFMGEDLETLTGWFNGLAQGGQVGQALEPQQWGDVFGLVKDQFGIEWMFNIGPAAPVDVTDPS